MDVSRRKAWLAAIDRFTWLVVGAVAVLTVAALTSVLVNRASTPPANVTTPAGVVRAYVQAIQAGQADRAWDLLAAEAAQPNPNFPKLVLTKEDFRTQVEDVSRSTASRIRIMDVEQSEDTASVQVEVTSISTNLLEGALSHQVTVTLSRQDGSWKITSDGFPWELH